ncbi:MAG: FkbM family methyltransferase [Pseudomonadota bacterium]
MPRPSIDRLPFSVRWKLLRQWLYASVGYGGAHFVALEQDGDDFVVLVDDKRIFVPSPMRWKLYRYGWLARLEQLAREYGVGRHIDLTQRSTVLDIGANAGEFAHIARQHGSRIFCCEPDPSAFRCLEQNVRTLSNVKTRSLAIWHSTGTIDIGLAPDRADTSFFEQSGERVSVPSMSIDDFIETEQIDRIDLIKCDAEGAEPEVLDGLDRHASKVGVIALDTGPERQGQRTNEACAERLRSKGFDVIEETVGKRCMTYGLNRTL